MSREIKRVYPIRLSRKHWRIPLYCSHKCSKWCEKIYQEIDQKVYDNGEILNYYDLVPNPNFSNGKCLEENRLEKAFISIYSFDVNNPTNWIGFPLYNPDTIIIPDNSCTVYIEYPLMNPFDAEIISPTSNGFSLKNLIYTICTLYKYIYMEEERTAVPKTFEIKKKCHGCLNLTVDDFVTYVDDYKNFECSICYGGKDDDTKVCQLGCEHVFHTHCIFNWIESVQDTQKINCPLCRQLIINCVDCRGSGVLYYDYDGVVIPVSLRGDNLNRNDTDGIFGIYTHDIEDLIIKNMYYNRILKRLVLSVAT